MAIDQITSGDLEPSNLAVPPVRSSGRQSSAAHMSRFMITEFSPRLWTSAFSTTSESKATTVTEVTASGENTPTAAPLAFLASTDDKTKNFYLQEVLLPYIELLDRKIYKIYHNVKDIKHRPLMDPETPDRRRIRFEIHLADKSAQILRDEKKFYAAFFDEVPPQSQDFFSFTYRIV